MPVALAPVEGEDAASLVDRQPAVHDDRALRSVLVERKIDEHRPLALIRQELVVGGPAKVACAGGAHCVALAQHHEVVDAVRGR